jgi:adenine nucleotide transporter 17
MPNESILAEVVAASVGGAFSASALYPLEVLKTKMQAKSKDNDNDNDNDSDDDNNNGNDTSRENEKENEHDSSDSQDESTTRSSTNNNNSSQHQQSTTSKPASTSALSFAKDLYDKQGLAPFYAGIGTSAFQSATEKALYFFAYTGFKNIHTFLSSNPEKQMGTTINLVLGCMAEWAHLPITLPLDCWTTQIQTGDNGNKGALAILMTMLSQGDGIRGMYKGIQAYTILCLKPAIQYTVFEQIKSIMLIKKRLSIGGHANSSAAARRDAETLTAMEAFFLGMVARTVATIVTFPYLRAKVVLQSQKNSNNGNDNSNSNSKPNITSMIVNMYMNGGISECYQGIGPELTRGIFSTALMMMMKEKISFVVSKALNDR